MLYSSTPYGCVEPARESRESGYSRYYQYCTAVQFLLLQYSLSYCTGVPSAPVQYQLLPYSTSYCSTAPATAVQHQLLQYSTSYCSTVPSTAAVSATVLHYCQYSS